jgi:hypothetical protein
MENGKTLEHRKTQAPATSETALFAREWNLAFVLVAIVAAFLFAAGYAVPGWIAVGLCVVAFAARGSTMHKQGRGFYGQEKQPR